MDLEERGCLSLACLLLQVQMKVLLFGLFGRDESEDFLKVFPAIHLSGFKSKSSPLLLRILGKLRPLILNGWGILLGRILVFKRGFKQTTGHCCLSDLIITKRKQLNM